ncbi:MAG: M1 family metallopeptidase [Chloroflexota bacterium]
MKKISASLLALSLLTISCQPATPKPPSPTPATVTETPANPGTDWDDRSIFEQGLVRSARPILNQLDGASVYHITFEIGSDLVHITGSEAVRYTNTEEDELAEVRFRLFANILGGEMEIMNIKVNDSEVRPSYELRNSLMVVPLPQALQPGQSAVISMDFTLTVPESVQLNYGVQAYFDDVLALAHAYPMIAVFDDEGWNAEIPPQSGDVTYADMSFFVVTVSAPKNVTVVGSGRETNRVENGNRQTVTFAAGPARDFYLAASPEYEVFTKETGGVTYRFYTRDHLQAGAESALDAAARAVEDFSARYAPYPYTELDFVSTPTFAAGIEYPGMIAITEGIVQPDQNILEVVVAHEVAHQWFYNLVGNDQLDDPWLDESLAQFATLQYFTDEYGREGSSAFRQQLDSRWSSVNYEDIPVSLPVAEYSELEYSAIVYGRGGLFFDALRDEIGEETFDAFLKDYTETLSWGISTPEQLQTIAEENCNCDLTAIFEEWIY